MKRTCTKWPFVARIRQACHLSLCGIRRAEPAKTYSDTLHLPKTTFPLRPNHDGNARDESERDLYRWQRSQVAERPDEFILHDGPPYANGDLHMGHALNKILKDIIVRRKILDGKRVSWVLGWDCHGLPIELKALQKHRSRDTSQEVVEAGNDKTALDIRQIARDLAVETIETQKAQFLKITLCTDPDERYATLDKSFETAQLKVFARMVEKGMIYRGEKPVYWSPSSRTALAEAELEYRDDHVSYSAYIAYPLTSDSCKTLIQDNQRNISLLIWTTTPWTLPANRAIAVNQNLEYSIVRIMGQEQLLVICSSLVDNFVSRLGADQSATVLQTLPGSTLISLKYSDIFNFSTTRAVLSADYVSSDSGTGLVHTAPGHGLEDYLLCRSLTKPILPFSPVDDAGNYTPAVGVESLCGLNVQGEGSKAIIELLRRSGHLLKMEKYTHRYPYDWRTKKPVIVRSTPQFFADLSFIRETALNAIDSVSMIPLSGTARLRSFVRGRDEWCISRQRSWGVPIPVLYDETGTLLMNEQSISHVIGVIEARGSNSWFEEDKNEHDWKEWVPNQYRSGQKWIRGRETLDVWFDSGCSWTTLSRRTSTAVADLYIEGTDQHRGWFQSSLLTSIATRGIAPYKQVITHGFVLDHKGRKMSKSIGNVIDPQMIISGRPASPIVPTPDTLTDCKERKEFEKIAKSNSLEIKPLGSDTLRLWAAQSDYTTDVMISPAILTQVTETLRKVRSTVRFLLGNLSAAPTSESINKSGPSKAIDKYALLMSRKFRAEAESRFANYEFNKVVSALNLHTNAFLSAFYFDTLKDRLYADHESSHSRISAQAALVEILRDYLLVLAPICPNLVKESWTHLAPSQTNMSAHIYEAGWNESRLPFSDADQNSIDSWSKTLQLKDMVNKRLDAARQEKLITTSLQADIMIHLPANFDLAVPEVELPNLFIVSRVTLRKGLTDAAEVSVNRARGEKCPRCWNHTAPAPDHLCTRCEEVLQQ